MKHAHRRLQRLAIAAAITVALLREGASATPLNPGDFSSLGTLDVTSGAITINTTNSPPTISVQGGPTFAGVVLPASGLAPAVAVFSFGSINIASGVSITTGGGRTLAILSQGDLAIAPTLAGGGGLFGGGFGGPGGVSNGGTGVTGGGISGGSGGTGNNTAGASGGGGGGGGHGFLGGNGGNGLTSGGAGGSGYGGLSQLFGGSAGGGGGGVFGGAGGGGGFGGGAIELGAVGSISLGTVTVSGSIGNLGAGSAGGGGGGAGGELLIHGNGITFTVLGVAGGNGGAGGNNSTGGGGGGSGGRMNIYDSSVDYTFAGLYPYTGGVDLTGGNGGNSTGLAGRAGVFTFVPSSVTIPAGQSLLLNTIPNIVVAGLTGRTDQRQEVLINHNVTIQSGGTATLAATNGALDPTSFIRVEGTGRLNVSSFGNQTISDLSGDGNISNQGALTLIVSTVATFDGPISGSGSFTKTDVGVLALNGVINLSGGLNVLDGTVIASAARLGSTPVNLGASSSALILVDPAVATLTSNITGTGLLQKLGAGKLTVPVATTLSGDVDLAIDGGPIIFEGAGRSLRNVSLASAGELRVSPGQTMTFLSGTNAGKIELLGNGNFLGGVAEIEFTNGADNSGSTALIVARDAANLRFGGLGLNNTGGISFPFSNANVFGDVNNAIGGQIAISGNSHVLFTDDVVNDGSISVSTGSQAIFLGSFSGANGTSGGGTVFLDGDLRPGHSPARVSFGGDVNFGAASQQIIELGGATRGTQYDAVDVTGAAVLDGQMHVTLISGFVALPGQNFRVMSFASRSGSLSVINNTGKRGLFFQPVYTSTDLTLQTVGFGGDADLNGVVNTADFTILAQHFNASGAKWLQADFNGDTIVNALDFNVLASGFGQSAPWLAPNFLGTLAPEPGMALPWLATVLAWRRHRRFVPPSLYNRRFV